MEILTYIMKKLLFIFGIIVICIFTFLLSRQTTEQEPQPSVDEEESVVADTQVNIVNQIEEAVIETKKKTEIFTHEFAGGEFHFEWRFDLPFSEEVPVYFTKNGETVELFTERSNSVGGRGLEFVPTPGDDRFIVRFAEGELSAGIVKNNVIHIDDEDNIEIVRVVYNYGDTAQSLSITKDAKTWVIEPWLDKPCKLFEDGKVTYNEGDDISVLGLLLDGKSVVTLEEPIVLSCSDPDGLGTGLSKHIELRYFTTNFEHPIVEFFLDVGDQSFPGRFYLESETLAIFNSLDDLP